MSTPFCEIARIACQMAVPRRRAASTDRLRPDAIANEFAQSSPESAAATHAARLPSFTPWDGSHVGTDVFCGLADNGLDSRRRPFPSLFVSGPTATAAATARDPQSMALSPELRSSGRSAWLPPLPGRHRARRQRIRAATAWVAIWDPSHRSVTVVRLVAGRGVSHACGRTHSPRHTARSGTRHPNCTLHRQRRPGC